MAPVIITSGLPCPKVCYGWPASITAVVDLPLLIATTSSYRKFIRSKLYYLHSVIHSLISLIGLRFSFKTSLQCHVKEFRIPLCELYTCRILKFDALYEILKLQSALCITLYIILKLCFLEPQEAKSVKQA